MTRVRLFWALELPEAHRRRLARIVTAPGNEPRVQWVGRDKLHVTLKFLGDVDQNLVSRVADSGRSASRGLGTFSLTLTEAGAFPGGGAPRVLWWGLGGDLERLTDLAQRLDEAMVGLGIAREERAFRPHVTLGRVRPPRGRRGAPRTPITSTWWREWVGARRVDEGPIAVQEILLLQSTLTPAGPIYEVRQRVGLRSCPDA